MFRLVLSMMILFVACVSAAQLTAADVKTEVVIEGLSNPCGVALQPGTGLVFVSDSAAGRIIRWNPKSSEAAEDAIVDFPQDVYGKGPMYNIGPLGLDFLNFQLLVVGGGGHPDGEELLRIYNVPNPGKTIQADAMVKQLGPLGPSDDTLKGEGNFYGIAATRSGIYVTCNGDDTKGWVSKAEVKGPRVGELKPFIATKTLVDVDAPVGITVDKNGTLLVGQMGEMNVPNDSLLTAYNPGSGKLIYQAETGLFDIAALAQHPVSGDLYAVDFAWMDTGEGGLFRLDVDASGDEVVVVAKKIVSLDRPSAMAFAMDGTLYVTTFGSGKEGEEKSGQLVAVSGL